MLFNTERGKRLARISLVLTGALALLAAVPSASNAASAKGSFEHNGVVVAATSPSLQSLPVIARERMWIEKGLELRTLPASVTSSLPGESGSEFGGDHCAENPGNPATATACVYGDLTAKTSVVLYGNSYAIEWIPAFNLLGKQYGFKVVTYIRYGCPYADIPTEDWLGSVDKNCLPFRTNVVRAINAMRPSPKLVVLSESFDNVAPDGSNITGPEWVEADQKTIRQLHRQRFAVVVLLAMVHTQFDPSQCLAVNTKDVQACSEPASQEVYGNLDSLETQGAAKLGSHTVNLSTLECDRSCPLIIDGILVRADKAHIDKAFATSMAPEIASLVGCAGTEFPKSMQSKGSLFAKFLPTLDKEDTIADCKELLNPPYSY
jgi:hypothetical protein